MPPADIHLMGALELGSALAARDVSVQEAVGACLERISAIDSAGPRLRSVLEVNPDASAIAQALQRELDGGDARGPLHGVPVLLKDNIDTGDRMLTTAGSLAMTARPAPADSPVAARLRAAGCVIVGKTNLSEWANFRSTRSVSGWSGRGRQTRNPHVLDRSPSGSSSGSAVAVAARLVPLAVGTETDGSITSPSSASGVVGIKPSAGLVPAAGIVPISSSQDTAGPHARSVADAAALLEVLGGLAPGSLVGGLDRATLAGVRACVLGTPYTGANEHSDAVFERALGLLRDAGVDLTGPVAPAWAVELRTGGHERTVLEYEFHAGLDAYLSGRPGLEVGSLADVVAWNRAHAEEEMPYFLQETLEAALERGGLDEPEYLQARGRCLELARDGLDALFAETGADVVLAPTAGPAWVVDHLNGDRGTGGASQPAAVAGYPHLTLPAGLVASALPVGISLVGRPGGERRLLEIGAALEAALAVGAPEPSYLPTLEIG